MNIEILRNDVFRLLDGNVVLDALTAETSFERVVRIAAEQVAERYPTLRKEEVEELLEFLSPYADELTNMIREFGAEEVAARICNAELFDSPYSGNFTGYDPVATADALKKLTVASRP